VTIEVDVKQLELVDAEASGSDRYLECPGSVRRF
jgi:hypothetical protein